MATKTYWWDGPGRIELLEKLVGEELSASSIAGELQDAFGERVTRNMVIGKCHRLGISLRGRNPKAKERKSAPSQPSAPAIRKPKEEAPMVAEETKLEPVPIISAIIEAGLHDSAESLHDSAPPAGKTLMQLEPRDCRWPIAADAEGRHLFCGGTKVIGLYCNDHHRLAYRPSTRTPPKKIRVLDPITGRVREKFVRGDDKEQAA